MKFDPKEIQLQYQGFSESHFLWKGVLEQSIENIDVQTRNLKLTKSLINHKLRLSKLVEQFVFNEFSTNTIEILLENIQIQNDKITIGELDCILKQNNIPIHLEIIYKFYLYDSTVGSSEIEHWIGPNRKDSFEKKYRKLVDKQLPLLFHNKTKKLLKEHDLNINDILQRVYFKAQLFPHLNDVQKKFSVINNDCIEGFYIYKNELVSFKNCKFFIPTKHNWLAKPHTNINWLKYEGFNERLSSYLNEENTPLCWLKKPNGTLVKFFVVWW